ncbi:MAG: RcnB family protein [Sphingobium sp.]
MKKFIFAIAAATLTATPVLAAPVLAEHGQPHNHQAQPAKAKAPAKAHQWRRGERFDRARATHYRVISNPRAYRLQNAPKGYRWVQSGRDALLVRLSNNIISAVVSGAFR